MYNNLYVFIHIRKLHFCCAIASESSCIEIQNLILPLSSTNYSPFQIIQVILKNLFALLFSSETFTFLCQIFFPFLFRMVVAVSLMWIPMHLSQIKDTFFALSFHFLDSNITQSKLLLKSKSFISDACHARLNWKIPGFVYRINSLSIYIHNIRIRMQAYTRNHTILKTIFH